MRVVPLVLILLGMVALPASAACVDPKALVIRPIDVPTGYVLQRSESGLRTNEQEAKESPEAGRVFRRFGRVTGYQMIFERGERKIEARADVFDYIERFYNPKRGHSTIRISESYRG